MFCFRREGINAPPSTRFANEISVVVGDGYNLRVLSVDGGAAVQNVEDVLYLRNIPLAPTTRGGTELSKGHG